MREDFLYYLWGFQKFANTELRTASGEELRIEHTGYRNELSGPDFFNARLEIAGQLWAGNVEMHLKSSHWYEHFHEQDSAYDNVILHVVWEHDCDVFRKDQSIIPVLELKNLVVPEILENYANLLETPHRFINCENDFSGFSDFEVEHWLERVYFERLEDHSAGIERNLRKQSGNWDAVFFQYLLKAFGLNVNGEAFQSIANQVPFTTIRKIAANQHDLESFLLGMSGLLENPKDWYAESLQQRFEFLKHKFQFSEETIQKPVFFRLRPDNFPTIRLAQIAALYSENTQLFSGVLKAEGLSEYYELLDLSLPEYWQQHYSFGTSHRSKNKKLSRDFKNLLVLNLFLPFQFAWSKYRGEEQADLILSILAQLPKEKNSIVENFENLRPGTVKNSAHSQAVIQLKKHYCDQNRCLKCALGNKLLMRSREYH